MKLSFANRGWENIKWDYLLEIAYENKLSGIELFDIKNRNDLTDIKGPLDKYQIAQSVRHLKSQGLSVLCLDTAIDIALNDEKVIEDIKDIISLACSLKTKYVAVIAKEGTESSTRENIRQILTFAEKNQVTVLIETCCLYSDSENLKNMLDTFASDYLAVLWNAHGTYRYSGEKPATTINNLGKYIKYVHYRDSSDDGVCQLCGEGTYPITDLMMALSSVDYDGVFSLEWRPEWIPEISDPEIILPHFVNYMERFEATKGKRTRLYPNFDGTGEYIFKKDELISYTFPQVLDKVTEAFPDQYAFKYTTLNYTRTYYEFREDVDNFARGLVSLGVEPGSRVAIWATNVPAWYISFWACARIGAVLVTMNTAYKIHEAEYLLRQSDTHTLIMIESCLDSNYKEIINELCPEIALASPGEPLHAKKLPFLRNVITVGFRQKGSLEFSDVMNRACLIPAEVTASMALKVKASDVVNMQYTSGTTGFPKGVMLTHYNIVNNGKCIGDRMGLSTADRMMIQVPMFHCFGMVLSMTSSMTHGATLCPLPYFSAKSALACINQERITCFNGVPTMFIAMFNHPDYRKTNFSYMRTGIMAGAGCPPELMKRAARPDEMNMRGIVSVYGQTESAPGSTMSAWTDDIDLRCNTVGYAFPHVEIKIVDPNTGETLPAGCDGEFCSRGYNTMKGYYKMPEATAKTISEDGWLHSGDLARMDEKGCYLITGRLKDMIIRGGENIYPKEIEEFIYTHPKVKDVQVIGVPDKKYGEEVLASIILKEGENMTSQEMHEYIAASMARHKVPRYIEFTDSFPMNAAGKILKYKMREEAAKRLGLM